MSDEIDSANNESQAFIDNALRAQRARGNPQRKSRTTCIDCDEAIPVVRQRAIAGCTRCVTCQHVYERGAR